MCKKCLYVFLAGAAAGCAVGHAVLGLNHQTVLIWGYTLTPNIQYGIAVAEVVVSALFAYLACKSICTCTVEQRYK